MSTPKKAGKAAGRRKSSPPPPEEASRRTAAAMVQEMMDRLQGASPGESDAARTRRQGLAEALARVQSGGKLDNVDLGRLDGMQVSSNEERVALREAARKSPRYEEVKAEVLRVFRSLYPGLAQDDEAVLALDPNDLDQDPSLLYERLEKRFDVPQDPGNEYFGGYGGALEDTIAFLVSRWRGERARGASGASSPRKSRRA